MNYEERPSSSHSLKSTGPWRQILWRCYRYLRPYRRIVVAAYLLVFAINGLSILVPQFIRWVIDRGIRNRNIELLAWSVAGLLILTLIRGMLVFLQGRWLEMASQNVAYDLRNDIQNKLTSLSFSYHDQAETGQLLSRAIQDVERIRYLTGRATWRVVDGTVLALGTAAILFIMDLRLAILVVLTLPVLLRQGMVYGSRYRPLSATIQDELGHLTAELEQNLRGARVVKAYAQEDAEIERFATQNETLFGLGATGARLQAFHVPLMDLIVNVGAVFIVLYGGLQVINNEMTLGTLVAFTTYLAQLSAPVRRLGKVIPALAMAASAGERIFAILDAELEVQDAPEAIPLRPLRGHVQFENVSFAYGLGQDEEHPAVSDLNFEAQPGQVVALLGATGSGKSTLTSLIPRFYDVTAGRVLVDGYDVRDVQTVTLRNQVGVVLQETTLFAATIRENVAFGRPAATEAEIVAAAKAAQAHDFITQMPDGYDTRVGEQGSTLSGGQKQRLAIARALLTDPRILILDDATASVDSETERLIQIALDRLMEGRTTFVIAHRLSTVRRADLILVLEAGCIVARGTHADLLKHSGVYRDVYQQQLRPGEKQEPAAAEGCSSIAPLPRLATGDA